MQKLTFALLAAILLMTISACGPRTTPVDNPSIVDHDPQFESTPAPKVVGQRLTKAGKANLASNGLPQLVSKMTSYAGKKVSITDFDDKPKVLAFWASWCGPCLKEKPYIASLAEQYPDIHFISLSVDEQMIEAEEFYSNRSIPIGDKDFWIGNNDRNKLYWYTFQALDDGTGNSAIIRLPTYVLIDETGRIINNDLPRPSTGKLGQILSQI